MSDEQTAEKEEKLRATMVSLQDSGATMEQIAEQTARTPEQVERCITEYRAENNLLRTNLNPEMSVLGDIGMKELKEEGVAVQHGAGKEIEKNRDVFNEKTDKFKLLQDAVKMTEVDRKKIYGDFHNNMNIQGKIMRTLNELGMNRYSEAHNTAIGYAVGKLVRISQGQLHRDNYLDAINYIAQAYDSQLKLPMIGAKSHV